MKSKRLLAGFLFCFLFAATGLFSAHAHSLMVTAEKDGDLVLLEAVFSDGSYGAFLEVTVSDSEGAVLLKEKTDRAGSLEFKRPEGKYTILVDAGPGHTQKLDGP